MTCSPLYLQTFIFNHFPSDFYGYKENDITMLIDDGDPNNIQPTADNIVCVYSTFLFERSSNEWPL